MPARTGRRLPSWLLDSGLIAAAMGAMNVATYGFTILAARLLGPRDYGALAALMGLLLVLSVISLGLQATGARRVSANPVAPGDIEAEIVRSSFRAAVALGALTLLASPLVAAMLRLDSWAVPALLAVSVVPLTLMGGYAGVLQGELRWGPLAAVYLAVGFSRLGLGLLGVAWRADVVGAMAGVAAGNVVPAVLGWWLLRTPREPGRTRRRPRPRPQRRAGSVLGEVAHNSHALLAFFAVSNADVVVARMVLDDHQSGLYAGGLIMTKAVLFLPQFVVVLAFPAMVSGGRSRMQRHAMLVILAMGGLATLGAWLLAPVAVLFVGGAAYGELESLLWAFAAVGTLLGLIQLVVYGAVARQQRSAVLVLWCALVVLVAAGVGVGSVTSLLVVVTLVDLVALLVLLVVGARPVVPHPSDATPPG
jgi:O-antigen/teichoic acid export membrane protein